MVHLGNSVYRLSVYTEVDSCSSEMVVLKTRTSSATSHCLKRFFDAVSLRKTAVWRQVAIQSG